MDKKAHRKGIWEIKKTGGKEGLTADLFFSLQNCRHSLAILITILNRQAYKEERQKLEALYLVLERGIKFLGKGNLGPESDQDALANDKIQLLHMVDELYHVLEGLQALIDKKKDISAKISELVKVSADLPRMLESIEKTKAPAGQIKEPMETAAGDIETEVLEAGEIVSEQIPSQIAENSVINSGEQKSNAPEQPHAGKPSILAEVRPASEAQISEVDNMIAFNGVNEIESTTNEVKEKMGFLRTALKSITDAEFSDYEAFLCWDSILKHRADLAQQLGRAVNLSVAVADYFTYVDKKLKNLITKS